MKNILITGNKGYIGSSFEQWVNQNKITYNIERLNLKSEDWKLVDFSKYDCVLHLAGIAHISTDSSLEDKYYKVNRDLTIELAKITKMAGVKQFIFMSSIIVFGNADMIDSKTSPNPVNFYGKSKLEAEEGLRKLAEKTFRVSIIRPPMIYGKNCKGNYTRLSKLATNFPFFPKYSNKRSVLHIDNLSNLIHLIIDNEDEGYFHPQNKTIVSTTELVEEIAKFHNKNLWTTSIFNKFIHIFKNKINIFQKVFGNLFYKQEFSKYRINYQNVDFDKSIELTERK
ncbi:NAD-dependent epimerase/dehydratase family protein [Priestia megaterium]|uniref:NAD-dependent epimerase/dehydratase family protein n=1 Tax=Priestia megaterium TaxID=1404 RepID=UPI0022201FE0|nr:NAD-dependent epimerase/dehydratase family protein [Priestia megaterium]